MGITAIKEDSVTGRGGVPWLSWLALASLAVSPAAMSQDNPSAPSSTLDEQLQRERTQRQVDAQQAARNAPDVRLARQAVADFHTTELPVETPCFDEIRHGCERTVLRHRERTARTCEAQRSVQRRQRADPRVKVFRKRCQVDLFFSKHCRGRQRPQPASGLSLCQQRADACCRKQYQPHRRARPAQRTTRHPNQQLQLLQHQQQTFRLGTNEAHKIRMGFRWTQ